MGKYIILTDSCCDLDRELREKMEIEYLQMVISYEGKEVPVNLDWQAFTPIEFYDMMRKGVEFKTSQVTIEMFTAEFKKYLDQGLDVLYISTSSGLSGSLNASVIARNMLEADYPDRKVVCVDSLRGSLGQGIIVYNAAKLRKEGKSIDEVAKWVETNRQTFHQVGSVDDLTYLKRAGRVTGMAALMGGIFKIKPIIISNPKGENQSVAKVRGRKTSIRVCENFVKQHIVDAANQTVFIVHADCLEEALSMKEWLLTEVKCKDVYINYVGPVIGATVGPGMFGIYFKGDTVTEETAQSVKLGSDSEAEAEAAATTDR